MPADNKSRRPAPLLCGVTCVLTGLISMAIPRGTCAGLPAESSGASIRTAVQLVQDEGGADETDVPPQDVDKYIKVYQAMQHNRNLTVEQAAAAQGLSVPAFRSLEDRIERNDALREHVRDALKPQASPSPSHK
ncbi:MAG: hypothetical protein JO121_00665 [Deltaproteobacteria bacterium]|nr:hypothetical protein [Deltaproteobacteria bacterium]